MIVFACVVTGCSDPSGAEIRLDEAEEAVASGDWIRAFDLYTSLAAADPDGVEARAGLETAVGELIARVPGLPARPEVALLRYLAAEERWDDLAHVLDASMVAITGGWGLMGSDDGQPDEVPARQVYLDAYRIDRYEVTNLEYASFVDTEGLHPPVYWTGGSYPAGTALHPVVGVSWERASAYCAWAGKRLPTEAEWERACRGTDGSTYPWGDAWDPALANVAVVPLDDPDDAWVWLDPASDPPASLRPVGDPAAGASRDGVCNLAGNATEWMADWYDPDAYESMSDMNPIGEGPPWNHAMRGGAWVFRYSDVDMMADHSRCAARNASHSGDDPRVGFRCAADLP